LASTSGSTAWTAIDLSGGISLDRRAFGASLLALGLGAMLPIGARASSTSGFLATGYDKLSARHLISRLGADLDIRWDLPLRARGHGASVRPRSDEGIVIARRPGTYASVFGVEDGVQRHLMTPAPGRHFYGHGAYSADGNILFATENDFDNARGMIGVYDANAGYARISEFPSGGIGPHQLLPMPDGHTLAVANGGILTHPDTGREKLNLDTMRPSLVFIDMRTGAITERFSLAGARAQKLSIRHMAVLADGRVAVGCQDQAADGAALPLVYAQGGADKQLTALPMPTDVLDKFNGYCGSVAFNAMTRTLCVSSPRGGLVGFWHQPDGQWLGHVDMTDGCGLAPVAGAGLVMSSGDGTLQALDAARRPVDVERHAFRRWDNHMTALDTA